MDTRQISDNQNDHLVVFTTLSSEEDARKLVKTLVESRVVACGTVLPGAVSVYRWKNEIVEESEALAILKTVRARWEDLQQTIERIHPYDVPELIALPVEAGWPKYLEWVTGETTIGSPRT